MKGGSLGVCLADRYEVRDVLGIGAIGEVRDGHDLRLDRPVAIKLLRTDAAAQAASWGTFEGEARAAARLSHPNVVAVYDTGEHDGVPYIVMERLPGRTLADEIARGPMDEGAVRRVGLQVLAALQAAHDLGIVHRDVKPANILLTEQGDAKVADFGIARSVDDDPTTGVVLGTAAYIAPERLAGARATPVSDLYSVGVVLYEALVGEKPGGDSGPATEGGQRTENEASHVLAAEVGPALGATIRRALADDPLERFTSAREMAESLEVAEKDATIPIDSAGDTARLPTSAVPTPPARSQRRVPRPARSAARRARRHTPILVIAALVVLIVTVGALSTSGAELQPFGPDRVTPTSGVSPIEPDPSLPLPLRGAFEELDAAVRR